MRIGKKRWLLKGVFIIGLVWKWMPVLVAKDGKEELEIRENRDESD